MDLIYRKAKYKEYLKKIELINDQHNVDTELDHTDLIKNNINEILEDLRDKSDLNELKIVYTLTLVPLIGTLVYHSYHNGLGLSFFYLVLLLTFFLYVNTSMKGVINNNKELKWTENKNGQGEKIFLSHKITYVESAIGIKQKRVELVSQYYMLFFAPLMYYLYKVIYSSTPFGSELTSLLIAYVICIPFWYIFFSTEMNNYRSSRDLLTQYQNEVLIPSIKNENT